LLSDAYLADELSQCRKRILVAKVAITMNQLHNFDRNGRRATI
jgi:hypothetical protein